MTVVLHKNRRQPAEHQSNCIKILKNKKLRVIDKKRSQRQRVEKMMKTSEKHWHRVAGVFSSVQVLSAVFMGFQATSCANLTKQNWSYACSVMHFELSFLKSFASFLQSTYWLSVSLFGAFSMTLSSLVVSFSSLFVAFHLFLVHYFSLLLMTMNEALSTCDLTKCSLENENDTEAQKDGRRRAVNMKKTVLYGQGTDLWQCAFAIIRAHDHVWVGLIIAAAESRPCS